MLSSRLQVPAPCLWSSVRAQGQQQGAPTSGLRLIRPEEFQQRVLSDFEQRLAYDQKADAWHRPLATELVQYASLSVGQSVLDVATGSGLVAELAALAVGATGTVIGIDISDGMLKQGERRAQQHANLTFKKADAEATTFSASSFDAVLCSNGLLYMTDVPAALERWINWLQPSGILVFNTPRSPSIPCQESLFQAAQDEGLRLEDPARVVGSPQEITELLTSLGLQNIQVSASAVQGPHTLMSAEDFAARWWPSLLRFLPLDSVLPSSAVSRIRAAWESSVHLKAQESTAGQISHKLEMLCVRALKAQS